MINDCQIHVNQSSYTSNNTSDVANNNTTKSGQNSSSVLIDSESPDLTKQINEKLVCKTASRSIPEKKPRKSQNGRQAKKSKKKAASNESLNMILAKGSPAEFVENQIAELRQEEADLPGLTDSGLSKEIDCLSMTIQQLVSENKQYHSICTPVSLSPNPTNSFASFGHIASTSPPSSQSDEGRLVSQQCARLTYLEQQMQVLTESTCKVDDKLSHQSSRLEQIQKCNLQPTTNVHASCQAHIEDLMRQKLLLQRQLDLFFKVDSLDQNEQLESSVSVLSLPVDHHVSKKSTEKMQSNGEEGMQQTIHKLKLDKESLWEKLDTLVTTLQQMSLAFKSTRDQLHTLTTTHRLCAVDDTESPNFVKQLQAQIQELQMDVQNAYKELHKEKLEKDKIKNEKEKIQHILSSELCSANEQIQQLTFAMRNLQEQNKRVVSFEPNLSADSTIIAHDSLNESVAVVKDEGIEKHIYQALQPLQKALAEEKLRCKLIQAAQEESMSYVNVLQQTISQTQDKNRTLEVKYQKLRKFLGIKKANQSSTQDLRDFNEKVQDITNTTSVIDENYKTMLSSLGGNVKIAVEILSSHIYPSALEIHPCVELAEDPSFWFAAQCSRLRWLQSELRQLCVQNWKQSEEKPKPQPPPRTMPPTPSCTLNQSELSLSDQQTKLTLIRHQQIDQLKHKLSPLKSDLDESLDSSDDSYYCQTLDHSHAKHI